MSSLEQLVKYLKMKQLSYLLLALFILTSCSNNKVSTSNQVDNLKQHFIPILNGVWVLTDYIEEIEKTQSPLKASDKLNGIVAMDIDENMQSDTIFVGISINNHEGYNFTTYFVQGQNSTSLKTNIPDYDEESNYFELGYETGNNQTFLVLYHYNKNNQLIDKKEFTKVSDKVQNSDVSRGLQYIVNKKLFSGNYLSIDSKNSTGKVKFNSDGSLTGFPDFKTYYVITDFLGGPVATFDEIIFNLYEENSKGFAFKIDGDTTFLYSTTGDEDKGEPLQIDKVEYKLVRQ